MGRLKTALSTFGLGATLMYFLDPDRGRRRRALVRDKLVSGVHRFDHFLDQAVRDLGNRAQGIGAEARSFVCSDRASDEVLAARVRSVMGHHCSHPGAIHVKAEDGRVTLEGAVLASELEELLGAVESVRGVGDVENRLEAHRSAGEVPALQGGAPRGGRREELRSSWSPTARLLVGGSGTWLVLHGASRRGVTGSATATFGAGLLARAIANISLRRLLGLGGTPSPIEIRKSLHVQAPPARVFEFFDDPSSFPRFMGHVREVRDLGEGRSHWVVDAPGGRVEWDARITRRTPNEFLAWTTEPGSMVEHSGSVRFEPRGEDACRIEIRMTYSPPGGVITHAVSSFLHLDAKSQIDDDLLRLKHLLETGDAPRGAREEAHAG